MGSGRWRWVRLADESAGWRNALGGAARATRRQAIRGGVAAAGALTGLSALLRAPALAAPGVAAPAITVYFQINWQQSWNAEAQRLTQEYVDANFNAQHKGVRAMPLSWGNASNVLSQVLAGDSTAPAVVSSCCGDFAVALPMLEKLNPLLQQDNLPTSTWSVGQLITYQEPDGLYGVPAYTACQPLIYSQSLFDNLGLPYPDPNWDYLEATKVWRSLAGQNHQGNWRYATTFQWYPSSFDGSVFLLKGFGGEYMDATHTNCLINSPASIRAGEWIYGNVWDKVIINRFGISGHGGASAIVADLVGMYQSAGNMLFEAVEQIGNKLKWDVLPMPSWPVQRGTNVQVDYYGMNAHYPNKELAWELFKFVAASQDTNRYLIRTTLSFPNLMSMWDEWETLVQQAAPITRTKALHWWADAARQGYGYGHEFWKYNDTIVEGIVGQTMQQIWNRQLSVVAGFNQIAHEVNVQQAEGPQLTALETTLTADYTKYAAEAKAAGHPLTVPPPPRTSVGLPATPAASLVTTGPTGMTVRGAGGNGVSIPGPFDGCTFAAQAWTKTAGKFTCRLVSLSPVKGKTMPTNHAIKVGIMARGSLSTSVATVFLSVNTTGTHLGNRPADGGNWGDGPITHIPAGYAKNGVYAGNVLLRPMGTPAPGGNWLIKPIWLRLAVNIDQWTGYTSLDGKTWTEMVAPNQSSPVVVTIPPIGVWVGLAVTSSNQGEYIAATFDNVSGFTPDTFVQVGAA